ncbi:hypothetical protein RUM43_009407 [Polyplax serrata]|uniref:Uncharacterized protein n=1 Tax=Polyplax serrata TaxID=468196 RepID=A0AAN8S4I2_POLSC
MKNANTKKFNSLACNWRNQETVSTGYRNFGEKSQEGGGNGLAISGVNKCLTLRFLVSVVRVAERCSEKRKKGNLKKGMTLNKTGDESSTLRGGTEQKNGKRIFGANGLNLSFQLVGILISENDLSSSLNSRKYISII